MTDNVTEYILSSDWKFPLLALRELIKEVGLEETFKWKAPCYTFKGKNIVMLASMRNYCVLAFFKGSFLADDKGLLIRSGENSQYSRQLRFKDSHEVTALRLTLIAYINEAILVEEQKMKLPVSNKVSFDLIDELKEAFKKDKIFESSFLALTPGRQRGYLLYFSAPKNGITRIGRIEKFRNRILAGKGIHDCVCGMSVRMPSCDGSHKNIKVNV